LHDHFEEILIKLLYRCLIGLSTLSKCEKIFAINQKKEELMRQFDDAKRKAILDGLLNDEATIAKLEKSLSKCCMQASRLYVQVI